MRQIEFRGFDKLHEVWVKGGLIYDPSPNRALIVDVGYYHGVNNEHVFVRRTEVDYNSVGQFTGLLDKNGNKIFEGDILECYSDNRKLKWVVVFCNGCFGISNIMDGKSIGDFFHIDSNKFFDDREIIGNIWEIKA